MEKSEEKHREESLDRSHEAEKFVSGQTGEKMDFFSSKSRGGSRGLTHPSGWMPVGHTTVSMRRPLVTLAKNHLPSKSTTTLSVLAFTPLYVPRAF